MRAALLLPLLLVACLPDPKSVKEARAQFDRASLLGREILDSAPPSTELGAVFGAFAELASYTLEPPVPARGDKPRVCFYWRALKALPEDYLVFVHGDALAGSAGRIHAEHLPASGRYPTSLWRPGEVVADCFTLRIPRDYAGERLALFTGLYRGDERVPLTAAGRVPADTENRSRAVVLSFPPR